MEKLAVLKAWAEVTISYYILRCLKRCNPSSIKPCWLVSQLALYLPSSFPTAVLLLVCFHLGIFLDSFFSAILSSGVLVFYCIVVHSLTLTMYFHKISLLTNWEFFCRVHNKLQSTHRSCWGIAGTAKILIYLQKKEVLTLSCFLKCLPALELDV